MPTYEYRCPRGHAFELFQSISADPEGTCPECGEAGERVISGGAGFLFKGEGFYITDYRSEEYKKKASREAPGGNGGSGGGSSAGASSGDGGSGSSGKDAGTGASGGGASTGSGESASSSSD